MSVEITAVQRGCVYDGDGLRTTVFLAGCTLRCPWCCNPETWSSRSSFFDESKCLALEGMESDLCTACELAGGERPRTECPFGAATPARCSVSAEELLDICLKDRDMFATSGGGVTFSGGEPLMQARNLLPVLSGLKENDIDICFETTLAVPRESVETVLPYTSSLIVDLKLQPVDVGRTPGYADRLAATLRALSGRVRIKYRLVFIDAMENSAAELAARLEALGVRAVELLQAHNLGANKYRRLGLEARDFSASPARLEAFATALAGRGIGVSVLKL